VSSKNEQAETEKGGTPMKKGKHFEKKENLKKERRDR
jgi:hypothetical protein